MLINLSPKNLLTSGGWNYRTVRTLYGITMKGSDHTLFLVSRGYLTFRGYFLINMINACLTCGATPVVGHGFVQVVRRGVHLGEENLMVNTGDTMTLS